MKKSFSVASMLVAAMVLPSCTVNLAGIGDPNKKGNCEDGVGFHPEKGLGHLFTIDRCVQYKNQDEKPEQKPS